ncbi:MAG: oligosaccharide flippase family protein [Bacteriovoracia bacterium]
MKTLHKALTSNLGWSAFGNGASTILRLLLKLALVRILLPDDFGLLSLFTAVTSFSGLFQNLGLQPAIINQTPAGDKHEQEWYTTGFTLQVLLSFSVAVLVYALRSPLGSFFNSTRMEAVATMIALSTCLSGISGLPSAILSKKLQFKTVVLIEVFALAAYCSLAILSTGALGGSIFAGDKAMGVIYSQIASQSLQTILLFFFLYRFMGWKPWIKINPRIAKKLSHFGAFVFSNQLLALALTQGDLAFLGRTQGLSEVGYYSMAMFIGTFVSTAVGGVVTRVVYPMYCNFRYDKQALQSIYQKSLSLSLSLVLPVAILTIFSSELLIKLFFPARWFVCVPLVAPLALGGFLRYWNMISCIGIEAEGISGTRTAASVKIIQVVALIPLMILGRLKLGTLGVAWATCISMGIGTLSTVTLVHKRFEMSALQLPKLFIRPALLGTLSVVLLSYLARRYI